MKEDLYARLIDWYDDSSRNLPWRLTKNPYNIWLSEIILQQTRVEQGLNYYNKFISNYPTVFDLARAEEDEVLKLWEGLGYYSRGRNLLHTAKYIVNNFNGRFPDSAIELKKLKGIGPYTSAAISSISNNEKVAAVDGNVFRVFSRVFNIENDISLPKTRSYFEELSGNLITGDRPGDYNQAIMDLGSLVCKPKSPICNECPLFDICEARDLDLIDQRPVKLKKIKIKDRFLNYLIFVKNDEILIQRRESGIWKGLYQFPLIESEERLKSIRNFSGSELIEKIEKPHKLSHQNLFISFWKVNEDPQVKNQLFVNLKDIDLYSWPKPLKSFIKNQYLI